MTRRFTRRATMATAAALAGCSVLPERPYQERQEYTLDVRRPNTTPPRPGAPVLLLRGLRAAPGLDARGLRTLLADGSEHLAYWQEWAVPPPQGIEEDLRQWLIASGLFAAVVMPGSEVPPDLALEGEALALAADLPSATARASLSFVLLRRESGQYHPVLQQVVTGTARLGGQDGAALAASLRGAIGELLGRIEGALGPLVG